MTRRPDTPEDSPVTEAAALLAAADDKVAAVSAAIARGDFIVCATRCYACQFGECQDPPAWHTWAEKDDIEHAKATGQPDPAESRCGCSCAVVREPAAAHEMPRDVTPQPCDVCGLPVTAAYTARTGRTRHANHPEGA